MITKQFGKGKLLNGNKPNDDIMTPINICKEIINKFDLYGVLLDPFKGTGNFYNNFPKNLEKDCCEIKENKDFFEYNKKVDWIISNPPYSIFDKVLEHSFEIADNIVYLVPLSKVVSSMNRIRKIEQYGGVPYIYILSASKCNFPFGFPACAIYIKKNYKGITKIEINNNYKKGEESKMNEREIEIAYEESPAQELEGLRGVINELRRTNKVLIKEIEEYEDRIDKVVEILKLCNTKCSKEVIQILLGEK